MTQGDDFFLKTEYQRYWKLEPDDRQRLIADEQTPAPLKALLLYQAGKKQLDRKQFAQAVASFDQSLELQSRWPQVWTERGLALLKLGNYEGCVDSCNHAVELNPEEAKTWRYRGMALYALRSYEDAANSCDRAVDLDPNDYDGWRTLSDSLRLLGRYTAAVESYDRALNVNPGDRVALNAQSDALQKLERYEEALDNYGKLLTAEPDNHRIWHQRGLVLRRLGNHEAAISDFEQALTLEPDFYPATRSKLFLLLKTGALPAYLLGHSSLAKPDQALTDLRQVLDAFVKTKLPTLLVLALFALYGTHSRAIGLLVAGVFLAISFTSDLISESRR
jgi:tetratricopeptide (TPR) repeat protein